MTIDEAIVHAREVATIQRNNKKLNDTLGPFSPYYNQDCVKCAQEHDQLAEWLEELKQYRAIGTPEECREAVEKQTAKKPDYEGDGYYNGQLVYDTWICPSCGQHYEVDYDSYDYCPSCGQKIRLER